MVANSCWNLLHFRRPIIAALQSAGFRVIAAAPADEAVTKLKELGAEIRNLPMAPTGISPLADVRTLSALVALFRRERPAAALTFTIKPNIYGALAARIAGVPAFPNVSGLGSSFLAGGALQSLTARLYRSAFRTVPAVFFQNPDDLAHFVESGLIRSDQARLLPGSGIDLNHFRSAPLPPSAPFTFLLIARMLIDKGVREFVEAAETIAGDAKVRFVLLGGRGEGNPSAVPNPEFERWLANGFVEYLPPTPDVRPMIAAAHCVVLPSYREGLPRALLEGAAMARPLVATDVPGCREVVRDGVNGFLCRVRSASSLADAMRRMLAIDESSRAAMGLASRALVEDRFGEERVVDAYLKEVAG